MGCRSDVRPCAPIEPSTPRAAVAADPGRVRAPAAADPTPVLRRHSVDFGARVDEAPDAAALRDPRGDLRVDRSRRRGEGAHVDPAHPGHEGAVQRSRRRGRPRAWPAAGWAERTNLNTAVTVPDWGQPVSPPPTRLDRPTADQPTVSWRPPRSDDSTPSAKAGLGVPRPFFPSPRLAGQRSRAWAAPAPADAGGARTAMKPPAAAVLALGPIIGDSGAP